MGVARSGFETYVKPSAKRCYGPGRADHKEYCVTTCQTALNNDFLKGHGDSEASGICCWNDCEDQLYNNHKFACYCDEEESESTTTSAPAVIRSLAEESEDTSDDNKEAAAQYILHNDFNVVEGTDANNAADLVGCQATGSEDVRNDPAKKQECLDECTKNSDCTGVVFHSQGSMLKKDAEGKTIDNMVVARSGFETYVKPSAKRCYGPGRADHKEYCVTTCQTALNNDFLKGHGDSEASGICCWNDCEDQLYNDHKFACYCDEEESESTTTSAPAVIRSLAEESEDTSDDNKEAAAQYIL